MNYYKLPLVALSILFSVGLSAQTYSKGTESKKADVNFTDLAKYYKEHPLPVVRKLPFDEDEEEDRAAPPEPDPSLVHFLKRAPSARGVHSGTPLLPVSPPPDDTFQSTLSDGSDIPPDTHGAVDSQYCITAINTCIHIQTRVGGEVSTVGLDGFWSSVLPSGTGAFDPRVHYDPYNRRWIIISDAVTSSTMTNSTLLIAVSVTNDPTGSWHMYAVPVDPTGASWLDFPCMGFNQKWITITGNMFPNTAAGIGGAVAYVFNYASIMAGSGAPYTLITESASFTLCPALTYDVTEPNMFVAEVSNGATGKLQLWKITGAVGSPVMTSIGFPTSSQHWHNGGGGDFVPQVGTTHKVQAGTPRITNLIYRNHHLWCAHTVFLPDPGTANRCSIMWWQIDTLANPLQNGLIDDPATPTFFDYPSIAVNANDDAMIGFGYLSASIHPSGAYAMHMHTDPLDSMRPAHIFTHGLAAYYETFGGTQNRWGDYSGTCIDPRNDLDFWTIQENSVVGASPNWDTWWANVKLCPTPEAPPLTVSPATPPCIGDTATYAIAPILGATSYEWIVSGSGWSGASTGTSIILTAGTGVGTIVVLAYNACGEGESNTFTITPATVPATPRITVYTPACVGSPTAVYSATSIGAVGYSWQALGTGWSGTSSSTSLTATVGTGPGTIICTTSNACGSSIPDTLISIPGVPPDAPAGITAPSLLCSGNTATFTTPAVTGATSYTWTVTGAGWSGSSSTNSITITAGTGAGTLTVIAVNACGSSAPFTFTTAVPIITPTAIFSVAAHITNVTENDLITYTGTAPAGVTYTWDFGGGTGTPGTGAGPQTVYWSSTGTKTITLNVNNGGCIATATDTVDVVNTSGLPGLNSPKFNVNIIPNPNDGSFDIMFSQPVNKAIIVKLLDMQGRLVYTNDFNGTNNNKVSIETNNLAPGIYIANMNIDGDIVTQKVTISK